MSRSITAHWSRSLVRASFLYMHCEPQELFCCCCCVSRSTFHEFPFLIFFLLYSSVAQTLKNVGPLDCKLRLFRRRSLCGKISVAEVMHLLTLIVFSANFRVVLVVAFFYFFYFFHSCSLLLFFPFFFSVVTSNFFFSRNSLGVHLDWDVICSTVDIVVAFKASRHWAGVYGAHSVQGHRRWGRLRQGLLGALEKKTWAWGMFPNLKFHAPANLQTCTEQTHGMFLDELWRLGHCFQSSCLLPLSFVIHGKVLSLTRSGPISVALIDPATT